MKIDLHVHTCYSWDSTIPIKYLRKLEGIVAITDHNTVKAWEIARKYNINFIPGEEISTNRGHVIGLFLTEGIEKKNIDFFEAIDRIRENDGLVYMPHPFDFRRKGVGKLCRRGDIIEVFNPRCSEFQNNEAYNISENMIRGAGSDAHLNEHLFRAYVEVEDVDIDWKDDKKIFLKLLKKGNIKGKYLSFFDHIIFKFQKIKKLFKQC